MEELIQQKLSSMLDPEDAFKVSLMTAADNASLPVISSTGSHFPFGTLQMKILMRQQQYDTI